MTDMVTAIKVSQLHEWAKKHLFRGQEWMIKKKASKYTSADTFMAEITGVYTHHVVLEEVPVPTGRKRKRADVLMIDMYMARDKRRLEFD